MKARSPPASWAGVVIAAVLALVLEIVAAAAWATDTDDKRVALVVGIGAYQYAPPLTNPPNDARRIAQALRQLNFVVDERIDPDFATLSQALRSFGILAQKADAAVVFFAGHGVQVDHENYLIPANAKLERERDLLYEALSLELFLGEVSQAKKVGIIILDACRNNPFSERITRSLAVAGRGSLASKGLARVDNVPRNTVVAMATKADDIAEDGSGENSPFTQAILAHLPIPGLELSLFFRSVRDAVLKATSYRQEPYIFSSLGAEPFYFHPLPPNRPPEIGAISALEVSDRAGPTPLGLPRPTDPDNDPLTVRIIGVPRAGEIRTGDQVVTRNEVLSLEKFMNATYKPDGKTLGSVGTLDFTVEDGRGGSASGNLPIAVVSSNHPPVVEAARTLRIYPGALNIAPPTDPDNDPLTITVTGLPDRGVVRSGGTVLKLNDRLSPQDLAKLTYVSDGTGGEAGSLRYVVDDHRGGTAEGRVDIVVASLEESQELISAAALWQTLRETGSRDQIAAFATLFPSSQAADEARSRLALAGGSADAAAVQQSLTKAPQQPASADPKPSSAMSDSKAPRAPQPTASAAPPATPAPPVGKTATVAVLPPPAPGGDRPASGELRDCANCPVMVRVPGGAFTMGVAKGDQTAEPAHRVTVRAFAMSRYPVTVAEWRGCMAENGCSGMPRMIRAEDATPVHNISWDDAQQYVTWLARKTGKKYRLPSEAEWEYAARANTETRYWWGNEPGVALANCADCGGEQNHQTPLPVDAFKPNPFGFYDMLGGVSQWVADCWRPNYQGAPQDGSPHDSKGCQSRVLRGGSFRSDHNGIIATTRNFYDASVRYLDHGFRIALTLD
jgi:formylglycine-generating enzyme required for sulfatase activity